MASGRPPSATSVVERFASSDTVFLKQRRDIAQAKEVRIGKTELGVLAGKCLVAMRFRVVVHQVLPSSFDLCLRAANRWKRRNEPGGK